LSNPDAMAFSWLWIPTKLRYVPSLSSGIEIPKIQFPFAILKESKQYWVNTLVGYFIKKHLPFPSVQYIAKRIWKHGLKDVLWNRLGFYFFQYEPMIR